jgi:hypothetical protein
MKRFFITVHFIRLRVWLGKEKNNVWVDDVSLVAFKYFSLNSEFEWI